MHPTTFLIVSGVILTSMNPQVASSSRTQPRDHTSVFLLPPPPGPLVPAARSSGGSHRSVPRWGNEVAVSYRAIHTPTGYLLSSLPLPSYSPLQLALQSPLSTQQIHNYICIHILNNMTLCIIIIHFINVFHTYPIQVSQEKTGEYCWVLCCNVARHYCGRGLDPQLTAPPIFSTAANDIVTCKRVSFFTHNDHIWQHIYTSSSRGSRLVLCWSIKVVRFPEKLMRMADRGKYAVSPIQHTTRVCSLWMQWHVRDRGRKSSHNARHKSHSFFLFWPVLVEHLTMYIYIYIYAHAITCQS